MLTHNSYLAFDTFSPHTKPIGGNLKDLWSYFESVDIDYEIVSVKDQQKKLSYQSVSNNPFIDKHLQKDILAFNNYRQVIIKSGLFTFHLHIHYLNVDDLDLLVDTLAFALSFTAHLADHKVKDITMTYYLLDVKRVLDGDTFFDKEEVNGGACWSSPEECDITVWRKEEIVKVSVHELIHGLSYDYKQDTPEIVKHYKERYGITSPKMNTFEAYTEIWAELIHSYLLARLIHSIKPNTIKPNTIKPTINCYHIFDTFVATEIEFSKYQSKKVLDLLKLDKDVNKDTNVTAYYLIKTELYCDLNGFLNYCSVNHDNFIKLTDKIKYLDYLKNVNILNIEKKDIASDYLKKTTRMTCLELEVG